MISLAGCFFVGCASAQSFQVQANPDVNPFSCVTKELAQRDFTVTTPRSRYRNERCLFGGPQEMSASSRSIP